MPLIGFAVVKYSHLKPGVELGLIALSCSPGGASSNAYAYLLGGDISISLTMTILSTTAALALLPLWFFTLGTKMVGDEEIKIPYFLIMGALVGIIMPCVLGIYIRRKHPNLAKLLIASIKYLMVFFCFVIGTVGVLLNWYVLQLMSPRVLLASALIPYIGYICGALTAFVLGQDRVSIITIAVETGIQNNGVPLVMMRLSLSGPERDTSIVGPVASALLSTQPLMLAVIVIHFLKKPGCPCAVITQVDVQPQISNGGICIEEHADKAQGTGAETN
ncbi:hypothetical protein EGW08_002885 [Elysia chlorotica]|uniref:P3 protein n=1 Tax=Elysia chlorotica TaxID=188477 RepID=A0A433U6B5_ELYCH|nr:hypothetical protein EGW08_002885 [Elysia chlorotica]